MEWIDTVSKIGAALVTLIAVFKFIRSEMRRLCRWLGTRGAGTPSKKSGS
jgi:hypothetical protein